MKSIRPIIALCLTLIFVCDSYNVSDKYGHFVSCFNLVKVCKGHKKINAAKATAFLNPGTRNSLNASVTIFHDVINPIQQVRVFRWISDKRKFTHLVTFSAKDMCIGSVFTRYVFEKFLTFRKVGKDCLMKKGTSSMSHLDLGKVANDIAGSKFFYGKLKAELLLFTAKENVVCIILEGVSQKDSCPKIV